MAPLPQQMLRELGSQPQQAAQPQQTQGFNESALSQVFSSLPGEFQRRQSNLSRTLESNDVPITDKLDLVSKMLKNMPDQEPAVTQNALQGLVAQQKLAEYVGMRMQMNRTRKTAMGGRRAIGNKVMGLLTRAGSSLVGRKPRVQPKALPGPQGPRPANVLPPAGNIPPPAASARPMPQPAPRQVQGQLITTGPTQTRPLNRPASSASANPTAGPSGGASAGTRPSGRASAGARYNVHRPATSGAATPGAAGTAGTASHSTRTVRPAGTNTATTQPQRSFSPSGALAMGAVGGGLLANSGGLINRSVVDPVKGWLQDHGFMEKSIPGFSEMDRNEKLRTLQALVADKANFQQALGGTPETHGLDLSMADPGAIAHLDDNQRSTMLTKALSWLKTQRGDQAEKSIDSALAGDVTANPADPVDAFQSLGGELDKYQAQREKLLALRKRLEEAGLIQNQRPIINVSNGGNTRFPDLRPRAVSLLNGN